MLGPPKLGAPRVSATCDRVELQSVNLCSRPSPPLTVDRLFAAFASLSDGRQPCRGWRAMSNCWRASQVSSCTLGSAAAAAAAGRLPHAHLLR